jgi:hypothetical protein
MLGVGPYVFNGQEKRGLAWSPILHVPCRFNDMISLCKSKRVEYGNISYSQKGLNMVVFQIVQTN